MMEGLEGISGISGMQAMHGMDGSQPTSSSLPSQDTGSEDIGTTRAEILFESAPGLDGRINKSHYTGINGYSATPAPEMYALLPVHATTSLEETLLMQDNGNQHTNAVLPLQAATQPNNIYRGTGNNLNFGAGKDTPPDVKQGDPDNGLDHFQLADEGNMTASAHPSLDLIETRSYCDAAIESAPTSSAVAMAPMTRAASIERQPSSVFASANYSTQGEEVFVSTEIPHEQPAPASNRRSFISALLGRSSSLNGSTLPSSSLKSERLNTIASRSMSSNSSLAGALQSRSSSSLGTSHQPRNVSASLVPGSSRPVSTAGPYLQNGRVTELSSHPSTGFASVSVTAQVDARLGPSAHEAVQSASASPAYTPSQSSSSLEPLPYHSPVLTATVNTTPNRAQRIRSHFSSSSSPARTQASPQTRNRDTHEMTCESPSISSVGEQGTSRLWQSPSLRSSNVASPVMTSEETPTLNSIGLSLFPLSPNLNLNRYGQPLCGAVIDGKYLLIGTTFGLDFLPLNRIGNRALRSGLFERFAVSSSSASSSMYHSSINGVREHKTRKPISLIRKTRFKQLVILAERSNVLLAIAGKNDHVRVYALDSLRSLIEKKMKEIEDKEGPAVVSAPLPPASKGVGIGTGVGLGLGLGLPMGHSSSNSLISNGNATNKRKGKARASSLSAHPIQAGQSEQNSSPGSVSPLPSPPPAYIFPGPIASSSSSNNSSSTSPLANESRLRSAPAPGSTPPRHLKIFRDSHDSFASLTLHSTRVDSTHSPPPQTHNQSTEIDQSTENPHTVQMHSATRRKSKDTIRRASLISTGGGTSDRRGSAATVTPGTVAALAAASLTGGNGRRKHSRSDISNPETGSRQSPIATSVDIDKEIDELSGRHGTTMSAPDSVEVEEGFQWVDAEGEADVSFTSSNITTTPSNPSSPLSSTLATMATKRRNILSGKMVPRSPIAKQQDALIDGDAGEIAFSEEEGNGELSLHLAKGRNKRRLSLAEILNESRVSSSYAASIKKVPRSPVHKDLQGEDVDSSGVKDVTDITQAPSNASTSGMDGFRNGDDNSTDMSSSRDRVSLKSKPKIMSPPLSSAASPPQMRAIQMPSHSTASIAILEESTNPGNYPPIGDVSAGESARQPTVSGRNSPALPFAADSHPHNGIFLQPRSPIIQSMRSTNGDNHHESLAHAGSAMQSGSMARSFSLQEMLNAVPLPSSTGIAEGTAVQSSPTLEKGSPARKTHRKRWSLFDGLRSSSSPPLLGSQSLSTSASSTSISMSSSRSCSSVDESVRQDGNDQSGAAVASSNTLRSPLQQPSTTLSSSMGSTTGLKPRPAYLRQESPPSVNLTPEVEIANRHPDGAIITFTQSNARTAPAVAESRHQSPHVTTSPNASTLEYVKLARTKGSKFIRASETSKKTYLAVLCGEQGERIELFTGSKNVSLSLNRTFVLPETPRRIEFQLQGEDLLDLYLIYDSAIFALEPSTVRVREVGIQRNERRQARRERERQVREWNLVNADPTTVSESSNQEPVSDITPLAEEEAHPSFTLSRIESTPSQMGPLAADLSRPPQNEDVSVSRISDTNALNELSPTDASAFIPYTTFQQLEYLPPVPPSALSSSYIIPPTYHSVVSASPIPCYDGHFYSGMTMPSRVQSPAFNILSTDVFSNAVQPQSHDSSNGPPRLNPVSLLANPTAGNPGPPGFFFVSKGKNLTSIVDEDGRSVFKKPISWLTDESPSAPTPEYLQGTDVVDRLEIILTQKKSKVSLAAFGPNSVRVMELGGSEPESSIEVIPAEALKRRTKTSIVSSSILNLNNTAKEGGEDVFVRAVAYLAKTGESAFFAEKVGGTVAIYSLAALG